MEEACKSLKLVRFFIFSPLSFFLLTDFSSCETPLNFSKIRLFYMIFSKYLLVFLITSFMEKRMRGSHKS